MWQALVLVCLATATFAPTAEAHAEGWVPPVSHSRILLGYGVAYPGGTHRGLDLSVSAGSAAVAPGAGRVVFAGSVPADGGGTCLALSLETAEGLRISLSPLQRVVVAEGDTVVAGQQVGVVDGAGDDSSAGPHIHVSVRRGETYLDPTGLLGLTANSTVAPAATPQTNALPASPTRPSAPPLAHAAATAVPVGSGVVSAAAGAMLAPGAVSQSRVALVRPSAVVDAGLPVRSALDPAALWPAEHADAWGALAPAALPVAGVLLTAAGVLGIGLAASRQPLASGVR